MKSSSDIKSDYRTVSVRAVITMGNRLLVEWFEPKQIAFLPGGTIESGEELQSALKRELTEELDGISVSVGRYLGKIGHAWKTHNGTDSCLNHFYEAEIASGESPRAREVGRELRWLEISADGFKSLKPPRLRTLLLNSSITEEWDYVDFE